MTATGHLGAVVGVVLLACGGTVQPVRAPVAARWAVVDESLSASRDRDHVRIACSAPGTDPEVSRGDRHPILALRQRVAA